MLTALSGIDGLRRLQRRAVERRWGSRAAPASSEIEAFLQVARSSFVELQAAWDAGDLSALGALTTDQLLSDLREQLAARGPGPNRTEVLRLDARLLAMEELQEAFIASVEFSGLICERLGNGASPFREVWMLADMKTASVGWRLARVQSLG